MQPDNSTQPLVTPLAQPVAIPTVNNIPQAAPVAAVKPKKAAPNLMGKIKGCATQFWLLITLVMLVSLIALASYTLTLITNGGVRVVFESPNRTSSGASVSVTSEASTTTSTSSQRLDIYFYLPVSETELAAAELGGINYPAGSVSIGNHEFVIPYLYKQNFATSAPLDEAIKGLKDQGSSVFTNGDLDLTNPFTQDFAKDWRLTVSNSGGIQVINVQVDNLSGLTINEINLAKGILQYTVERYSQAYEIHLNGSKSDYIAWGDEVISN